MQYTPMFQGAASSVPSISELGFGCSAVGGRVSRRESLTVLGMAYDAGVTLYDTARSYGYGQSESIVGEFVKGRRESLVVCTKFGILPGKQSGLKHRLKPVARTALRLFPGLRRSVQRQVQDQFVAGQFSVEDLRSSFEASLRELKTDYVDILLLHAAPATVLAAEDLLEAIGRLVESGKVRRAGISGEHPVISQYFQQRPHILTTAQFAMNLSTIRFTQETQRNQDLLLVGNHPFGGSDGATAAKSLVAHLQNSIELPKTLREKLDPADEQVFPELILNCVLRATGLTAVVASMMQAQHIRSNVKAVEQCRFSTDELELVRSVLQGSKSPSTD
jgi:aryl-alcohol dehydrogenase-like predicted oxidoreductase